MPNAALYCALLVATAGSAYAATSTGFSPIFAVDARAVEQPGSVVVSGRVVNGQGAGLAGVRVNALQNFSSFIGATTDAAGNYQLPALAPGVWELWAMKDGYVTGVRSGLALVAGQSTSCNFTLATAPPLTNVSAVNRDIEASQSAKIVPVTDSQLKVFVGGAFTTGTVDRSKPTVIFTHGWNSDPTVWAEAMAGRMATLNANLLAWDWQTQADTIEPVTAMARTRRQGEALGKALFDALGTNYAQSLHFIGHSLGTLVNASAANYLHWRHLREQFSAFGYERTHITLLDDAGGVSKLGKAVTFDYTVTGMDGSLASSVVENGYVSPVPDDAAWVDNYYSFVGKRHPQAVNVLLPKAVIFADRTNLKVYLEQVHRYPCNWYAMTVLTPTQCLLGHRYSFERSGLATAFPSPSPYPLGTDLSQDLISNFELDLVELESPLDWSDAKNYQARFGIPAAGFSAIQWAAQGSVNLLSAGVQKVGNVVENVSETLSSFAVTHNGVPVYSETADSTTMYYLPEGTELQTEVRLSPRFQLTVPSSKPSPMPRVAKDGGPGDSNGPPAVWMSVAVPSNTLGMAFNFTLISGDTNDDYLAFGINGTNVFALETRFMPAGQVLSSGMIDISAYAGQSVEFFFGVLGGNSTNTSLAVDGIRFYQEARPALSVASSGNEVRLLWPITHNTFVLETATALTPVPDWKQMTNIASVVGLENVVTNALPPGSRFFRLRQAQ